MFFAFIWLPEKYTTENKKIIMNTINKYKLKHTIVKNVL